MRLPFAFCLLVLPLLSAAASAASPPPQPLGTEAAKALQGARFAVSEREIRGFSLRSDGTRLMGPFGSITARSRGNEFVEKNQIPDPAVVIGGELALSLESKYGALREARKVPLEGDEVAAAAQAAGTSARFVLDATVNLWELQEPHFGSEKFVVRLVTFARVFDLQTKTAVAKAWCERVEPRPRPHDDWVANGGALLKASLAQLTSECVAFYRTEMLRAPAVVAVAAAPKPVAAAAAASGVVALTAELVAGHTWTYPHPRDPARWGDVELRFQADGRVSARNRSSQTQGTWALDGDQVCATLQDWGRLCLQVLDEGGERQVLVAGSGRRSKLTIQ